MFIFIRPERPVKTYQFYNVIRLSSIMQGYHDDDMLAESQ